MSNIIDSIKVSGVTYEIQGSGGGGVPESAFTAYTAATDSRIAENEEVTAAALNALDEKIDNIDETATVELTQAQYNALVTAGTVSADTYYIITDAQAGDLTNYYTKTETNTLLGGKQTTLVSGTNIKTINNESILGSGNIDIQGGGKAVTGGTNISITTGATADTINCTLPISASTKNNASIVMGVSSQNINSNSTIAIGQDNFSSSEHVYRNIIIGDSCSANTWSLCSIVGGGWCSTNDSRTFAFGLRNNANAEQSTAFGEYVNANNKRELSVGYCNLSNKANNNFGDSGNTLFSVGNGTGNNARHNALEVRQNGDIYLNNGTSDVKLQDYLQIKAVQITQSDYDQLQTKDPNTLYVIVN